MFSTFRCFGSLIQFDRLIRAPFLSLSLIVPFTFYSTNQVLIWESDITSWRRGEGGTEEASLGTGV